MNPKTEITFIMLKATTKSETSNK